MSEDLEDLEDLEDESQTSTSASADDRYSKAYIFSGSGDAQTLHALAHLKKEGTIDVVIRLLSGDFGAIASITAQGADEDALRELRRKIQRVRNKINPPPTDTAIAIGGIGPEIPVRWKAVHGGDSSEVDIAERSADPKEKYPVGAFIRIVTEPGQAISVAKAVRDIEGFWGVTPVTGTFDVLLELGTETFGEIRRIIRRGLVDDDAQPIHGVISSISAISLNPRNDGHVLETLLADVDI